MPVLTHTNHLGALDNTMELSFPSFLEEALPSNSLDLAALPAGLLSS